MDRQNEVYIHSAECYSPTKRNVVLMHAAVGMNLENMLTAKSQTQKATYCMGNVQNRQIHSDRKLISGCQRHGGEGE